MEFKVNSKSLEKLLTKIIPAVPSRTPMPILENFLFELKDGLLTIYATDLEIALKSSLNVVAEENMKLVVPARLLYDIVRSLQETTILFQITPGGKINLKTDNGVYTISYLLPEEFPDIPTFPEPGSTSTENIGEVIISGNELKRAIDQTSFAMSKEDMRPAMMGTLMEFTEEGLRFVSTDGHRLVNLLKKEIHLTYNEQYIVPERAISVLVKILEEKDVKILLSKTYISYKVGDIEFITRLIAQKYPDYKSVIPLENENKLKIRTAELLSAVKRMLLFSPTNSRKVKFSITANNVEISAEDIDQGAFAKENIYCEYSGESIDIGFNSAYVNDVISHLQTEEEIYFKLHSPTKAVIIEPVKKKDNEDIMMLLMPVRLNN
ncbi:MAG: DNA polymerase III subunit beta [Bacteroidota bacterium]|nr:DNA polymerase III subunit beta [Bacteroidota bacterium]MDP4196332.1 DNA polymerase III subunit beta [Bacteroidota bacterium]